MFSAPFLNARALEAFYPTGEDATPVAEKTLMSVAVLQQLAKRINLFASSQHFSMSAKTGS
jgi:hypothetical protein